MTASPLDLLDLDEAIALASAPDDTVVGAVAGRPGIAVAVDGDTEPADLGRLMGLVATAPLVVVAVATDAAACRSTPPCDVAITDLPDAPRPWVSCPDGTAAELVALGAAIEAAPGAATALAQLLRVGEELTAAEAVVAESWVYSLLQSGEHHRTWLAGRAGRVRRPRPAQPVVRLHRDGGTLHITLDRPEVRNAYGMRMRDELVEALLLVEADPSIASVDLRGTGPAFCSGGDLDEFGTAADPVTAHVVRTTRNAGLHVIRVADRVVAHVHGACVGAGVEIPAFAHEVVARSDATFLLPEVAMGLVPGAGGTSSIPRRIGRQRTAHLALRGRSVDAATALAWGLVDAVDDDAFAGTDRPASPPDPAGARP